MTKRLAYLPKVQNRGRRGGRKDERGVGVVRGRQPHADRPELRGKVRDGRGREKGENNIENQRKFEELVL